MIAVKLVCAGDDGAVAPARELLATEFPPLPVVVIPPPTAPPAPPVLRVDLATWRAPDQLDRRVAEALATGPVELLVVSAIGPKGATGAAALVTRYQRLLDRRNDASRARVFDAILARHVALHDLDKPLPRADHEHALDAWHWMLRLAPAVGLAPQIAALFHDVERLASEADVRVEHRAPDYRAFKQAHARDGAAMTRAALADVGLDTGTLERVVELVAAHERPAGDPELDLLNDADALSFFSLNSPGFIHYYGVEHTRRKVAYTLARMSPGARRRLAGVRLRTDVARLVEEQHG